MILFSAGCFNQSVNQLKTTTYTEWTVANEQLKRWKCS